VLLREERFTVIGRRLSHRAEVHEVDRRQAFRDKLESGTYISVMLCKRISPGSRELPTEVIEIQLDCNADGSIDRTAPFVVLAPDEGRDGLYSNEPAVLAQLAPDEDTARFEATWDGEEWLFGPRVQDA
jgi:hypothetical protein